MPTFPYVIYHSRTTVAVTVLLALVMTSLSFLIIFVEPNRGGVLRKALHVSVGSASGLFFLVAVIGLLYGYFKGMIGILDTDGIKIPVNNGYFVYRMVLIPWSAVEKVRCVQANKINDWHTQALYLTISQQSDFDAVPKIGLVKGGVVRIAFGTGSLENLQLAKETIETMIGLNEVRN